jgi:hypothetical protein
MSEANCRSPGNAIRTARCNPGTLCAPERSSSVIGVANHGLGRQDSGWRPPVGHSVLGLVAFGLDPRDLQGQPPFSTMTPLPPYLDFGVADTFCQFYPRSSCCLRSSARELRFPEARRTDAPVRIALPFQSSHKRRALIVRPKMSDVPPDPTLSPLTRRRHLGREMMIKKSAEPK